MSSAAGGALVYELSARRRQANGLQIMVLTAMLGCLAGWKSAETYKW